MLKKRGLKNYWCKTESEDDSEMDLENELHPLADHVHDRKRLFHEATRSLKGKRLKAMIPPILKDMAIEELEERCLDILDEVDVETVFNILDGKLAGVFDDPVEATPKGGGGLISLYIKDEGSKKGKKKLKTKGKKKVGGTADDKNGEENKPEGKKGKTKEKSKKKSKESLDKKKGKKKLEKKKEVSPVERASDAPNSLLELLELEFRAKAINALLRAQGVVEAPDSLLPSDDLNKSHDKEQKEDKDIEVQKKEKDVEIQEEENLEDAEVQEKTEALELDEIEVSVEIKLPVPKLLSTSEILGNSENFSDCPEKNEESVEKKQIMIVVEDDQNNETNNSEKPEETHSEDGSSSKSSGTTIQLIKHDLRVQEKEYLKEPEEDEKDLKVHYVEEKCIEIQKVQEMDEDSDVLILQAYSPVEFITNFDDIEPISTVVENEQNEREKTFSTSIKAVSSQISSVPVQGCEDCPNEIDISNENEKAAGDEFGPNRSKLNEVDRDEEEKPITWYERWFQSSSMQKVVKTNKIQKKLRSKLKSSKPQEKKKEAPILDVNVTTEPIIGSIEEYEKLFGKKVTAPPSSSKDQEKSDCGANDEKENESFDENDDDGMEDLWEDIINS